MKYIVTSFLMCSAVMTSEAWAVCPRFVSGQQIGTIKSPQIREISGVTASRKNPSVLWVHNDSGDWARVYAINISGETIGVYSLSNAEAVDWEDIAIGPGPVNGLDYLYCGDIGDNNGARSYITIYRFIEPHVGADQVPAAETLTNIDTLRLRYPDGARDAETLMVDPQNGDIYIISKRDLFSKVYRAPYPQSISQISTMELVAVLPWGLATGGDISPAGNFIIVRGYFNASLWKVENKAQIRQAFGNPACSIALLSEPQGEAICFSSNGCGYFTTSEGSHQPLYYFARNVEPLVSDLDGDCDVDIHDLAVFICAYTDPETDSIADLDGNGHVDSGDLALFADQWLLDID